MGEWKEQLSLRVKQQLRIEIEEFAAREHRTLGNIGELSVTWAFEQLKKAGSTEKLLNRKAPIPQLRKARQNFKCDHGLEAPSASTVESIIPRQLNGRAFGC